MREKQERESARERENARKREVREREKQREGRKREGERNFPSKVNSNYCCKNETIVCLLFLFPFFFFCAPRPDF